MRDDPPLMNLAPFLASSAVINSDHPSVRQLAGSVCREDQLWTIRATYELVRDRFAHSYDIGCFSAVALRSPLGLATRICCFGDHWWGRRGSLDSD
jgi:hypothetical protein